MVALSMLAEVGAGALDLCRAAPAGDRLGDREGDGRADRRPGDRDGDRLDLNPELAAQRIVDAAGTAERGQHGDRGEHRADQAADAVDAEYVERIVEAELRLLDNHEPAAGNSGDRAEQARAARTDRKSTR